jgi:MULE transposase domain
MEFISANKLLVDSHKLVHGPAYRVDFSQIYRKQDETPSIAPDAPNVPPILSDPFEYDVDPFVDEHGDVAGVNRPENEENINSWLRNQPLTASEKPFEGSESIENLYANQRSWRIFYCDPTRCSRKAEESSEEEWEGFDDISEPSREILLPLPPVESFESRETALQSVQEWAREHGYALRIRSSRKRQKEDTHPYFTYLECDRGGKNKPASKVNGQQLRKSSSRRRECPFRCILAQSKKEPNGLWRIQHSEAPYNMHNHGPSFLPTAHPIHRRNARKSRPEILNQIQNNKLSRISARDTLSSLQQQFPEAPLTLRDIENVYGEVKKAMNRGLPAVQAMISKLGDEFQFHYVLDNHDRLERVLFFHNASLQLLRLFPKSYILDATYRTNRFNLPLLDIVGFTATNRSFIIGQAFLTHEEEEDYIWVLQWIRELYEKFDLPLPESITTDKAGGLHNACGIIWPEVPHLLCRWHIDKDVKSYIQKHWLERTALYITTEARKAIIEARVKEFTEIWSQLLYTETEAEYERIYHTLWYRYRYLQPKILAYLDRIWLPHKETFIQAWTNKVRHYGNVDSSRAEGVHQAIKRRMGSKQAHLKDVVDHLLRYLNLHNKQLREELEYGQQNERTDLQNPLYRKLHGHISYYAIDQVEAHRRSHNLTSKNAHLPLRPCKHIFTITKGLPCSHLLQQRMNQSLPLKIADFDIQWRIDRLGELAELPPLRKITDPLTVSTRYTKSQKRQLSLYEVIQKQVDSLTAPQSSKGKGKAKACPQTQSNRFEIEQEENLQWGTALQPIAVDDDEEEELYNSEEDPLGAELQRKQRQALTATRPIETQIRGWIEYQPLQPKTLQSRPPRYSPLFRSQSRYRTPSPFADSIPPILTPSPLPSTPSPLRELLPLRCSPEPTPAPRWSPQPTPPPRYDPPPVTVSPMTSPAKKRPRREAPRPQRYRE